MNIGKNICKELMELCVCSIVVEIGPPDSFFMVVLASSLFRLHFLVNSWLIVIPWSYYYY